MKTAILDLSRYSSLKINTRFLSQNNLLSIVAPTALVDYRFKLQGDLANYGSVGGSLALTRSGNGTFIGSNGLLQTAGANVARFDFDPVSLTRRGLLFEGQATNVLQRSEALTTGWAQIGGPGRSTYSGTLPNGSTGTIERAAIAAIATTGQSYVYGNSGSTQASFTSGVAGASAWIKRVSGANSIGIYAINSNLTPDLGGAYAGEVFTITDSWVRYSFAKALTGTRSNFMQYQFGLNGKAIAGPYSAVTIDIWGLQLQTDRVDSYIPTTGSTATRYADAASLTGLPTANVTLIEKPAGCATLSAGTLTLNPGYTIDRIMVLPGTYPADQVETIRGLM
jgi:hypothetical protein